MFLSWRINSSGSVARPLAKYTASGQVTSRGLGPDVVRCRKRHGFLALSSLSSFCHAEVQGEA